MADFEMDADLQAYVEERLGHPFEEEEGQDGDAPDEEAPEEEPAPDEGEGEEESPPAPSEPSPSNILEVAPGVAITREQALSYYEFDALLRGRPDLAQEITALVNGHPREAGEQQPATPASLNLPEGYEDDPYVKPVYDAYNASIDQLKAMQQRLDELERATTQRDNEEMNVLIDTQRIRFQQENSLTDDEMNHVVETAGRLNVLPALINGTDPITGQAEPRDRATALHRAFEIAYWSLPEMRDRALQTQVTKRATTTRRKQRLAGVSGGGGGAVAQNTDPRSMSPLERRAAMIAEVAGLTGNEEA